MYTNNLPDDLVIHKITIKDIDKDKNEIPFKVGSLIGAIDNVTLRSVDSIEWITTKKGKLTDLTIYFNAEDN